MGIYILNLSFNYYESFYILAYKYSFYCSYKPFKQKLIVDIFLDKAYQTIKIKVDTELASSDYLNFFIDKSINI